ncbi:MAG: hypothetical protein PF489_06995 [Salinivirgaceae bacterium]|jgi:hypothetical protein|nr:hypothetical protein [Salinivirgaceae bacterium]
MINNKGWQMNLLPTFVPLLQKQNNKPNKACKYYRIPDTEKLKIMVLYTKVYMFSEWLKSRSSIFNILLFLVGFITLTVFIFPYFKTHYGLQNAVLLDVLFGFSPERAYDIIASYGDYGRKGIFVITGIVDFIYPLVYGPLLALLLSRLIIKLSTTINIRLINLLPFVVVLFDFIENTGILFMTANYPAKSPPIAWLTSVAGIFKWLVTGVCIVTLLILLIKKANKKATPNN